jgi:hypothetical protein
MHRIVVAALLAGFPASVPALAEELGLPGEPVLARLERPEGARYEITVTPPADRGVDRRVMEWLTDAGVEAERAADADADPVDMSGYRIRVEKVAGAECTASFAIKSKPTNLGANKAWVVESDSATHISASAFPTKGDVDIRIYTGNGGDVCDMSAKKKQNMDSAGYTLRMCQLLAGIPHVEAEVANPTSAQATAVADFILVFVTLP